MRRETSTLRRKAWQLIGAGLLACAWPAHAAETPAQTYALLSLVGDRLTAVTQAPSIGSSLDKNLRERIDVKGPDLVKLALMSADDAVSRLLPGIQPVLLMASDKQLYEVQNELFENSPEASASRQSLQKMLRSAKATRLILISGFRADTSIKLARNHTGTGKLSGLGFFMEEVKLINEESLEKSSGYLAPYAYLRISLIDVDSMKVLQEGTATASKVITLPITSASSRLWDTLNAEQKVTELKEVIDAAIAKAMPLALAAP